MNNTRIINSIINQNYKIFKEELDSTHTELNLNLILNNNTICISDCEIIIENIIEMIDNKIKYNIKNKISNTKLMLCSSHIMFYNNVYSILADFLLKYIQTKNI
jgi:hypothetical protein